MIAEVANAITILQGLNDRYFYSSPYWTERIDRAIDILVRNPYRAGNPSHLARNASSDARKVLHRRWQICPVTEMRLIQDPDGLQQGIESISDCRESSIQEILAIEDWFDRVPLNDNDRAVLSILLSEGEAEEVAQELGLTLQQARVRISRARNRAKKLWTEALNV